MTSANDHDAQALMRFLNLQPDSERAPDVLARAKRFRAALKQHLDPVYSPAVEPIGLHLPTEGQRHG